MIPFVIDNDQHRLSDVLNASLDETSGQPLDIGKGYFSVAGYRLDKDGLHKVGAFRLLPGAEPHSGVDIGLRPAEWKALLAKLRGDLEASPFNGETLRLVEGLIPLL